MDGAVPAPCYSFTLVYAGARGRRRNGGYRGALRSSPLPRAFKGTSGRHVAAFLYLAGEVGRQAATWRPSLALRAL